MPLFGASTKKQKPSELVKLIKDACQKLEKNTQKKEAEKLSEEIGRNVASLKVTILGEQDSAANPETIQQVTTEMIGQDVWPAIIKILPRLEESFETKKLLKEIFAALMKKQNNRTPFADYLNSHFDIIQNFASSYEQVDIPDSGIDSSIVLTFGAMLREACKNETLAGKVLAENIWKFFKYVEFSSFDIASDAFSTFKELLTRHKKLVSDFIYTHHSQFFSHYKTLLESGNYVTRRQSLKLLGELLLDKANFKIMTTYISDPENLKMIMILLRDKKKSLQFEAFHVFKVFVANPEKPESIEKILVRNKEKLILFLEHFQTDKDEEQFKEEKRFLLKQVMELPNWQG